MPRPVQAMASAVSTQAGAMLPAFLTGAVAVQLGDDVELSEARLGAAVAFFFLLAAVASPHAGALTDRLGPRRSLRIAACLSATSLLGSAAVVTSYPGLLATMAIGGIGLTISGPGTKVMVAKAVPVARHGLAFGVQAGAVPLASFLAGLAVSTIAIPAGWRWAYVAAAVAPAVGFALAPAVHATVTAPRPGAAAAPPPPVDYPPLVVLALAVALGAAAASALAAFFVPAATQVGIADASAGYLLAATSALVIVARVVAGVAADRRRSDPLRPVVAMMAVSTVGYAVTGTDSAVLMPLGGLFALAVGWSWSGLVVHGVVRRYSQRPGAATGMVSGGQNVGGVVGPLVFGLVAEHASYRAACLTVAGCAALGAATAATARRLLDRGAVRPSEQLVDQQEHRGEGGDGQHGHLGVAPVQVPGADP